MMNLMPCALLLASLLSLPLTGTNAPSSLSRSHLRMAVASMTFPLSDNAFAFVQETGDEITGANWQRHPKIKAVRAVYQTVKSGLSRKSLKVRTRRFDYCEPYEDGTRVIATDASGRVRYYEKQAGSDDSALKWEHYYDEAGRLRFVLITGGAANGSQLEHRIYFGEDGKRLHEEHKYTKGPGYTFPAVWPNEQLQLSDPAAAFAATSRCMETKSKKAKRKP